MSQTTTVRVELLTCLGTNQAPFPSEGRGVGIPPLPLSGHHFHLTGFHLWNKDVAQVPHKPLALT